MDSTYSLWMQSVFSNVVHRLVKSQLEASSFASASKGLETECYEWSVPKSGTEGQHTTVQKTHPPITHASHYLATLNRTISH